MNGYKVLLGGIGDDAHSVGINLIALGLKEAGYFVHNIGIQNSVDDFFVLEKDYHAVFISSKNGHSGLYLNEYAKKIIRHTAENEKQIWYIGGHLSITEKNNEVIRRYMKMGFDRVFPNFIPMKNIIEFLENDIKKNKLRPYEVEKGNDFKLKDLHVDEISDKKWDLKKLEEERIKVLSTWETGLNIDWSIVKKLHSFPNKNLNFVQVNKNNTPLLQPRTGVANLHEQIEKLKELQKINIDVASVQLDASTRVKNYQKAKEGVEISNAKKTSFLNGFPVPIYGQKGIIDIVESLKIPFQIRGGAPDHRLTYEIAISGGSSAVEGGFLCYLFPYDKETSPSESLRNWQYVDRLAGLYYERDNIIINREWFGVLTANLIPPSLAIAVNIIQTILSAKQGVKSISIGYAEQGNRSQDIAAMQANKELNNKYLRYFGINDVTIPTVFHQYMAAFPSDFEKSEMLIFNSAVSAQLSKADRMMMKSPVEAHKIPSTKENQLGVKISKRGFLLAKDMDIDHKIVNLEKKMIHKEVDSIISEVLKLGDGDLAKGAIKAFAKGTIDIPFSPSKYNRGEVVCIRDINGAVRYAQFGNLPFDEQVKEFHMEKVEERKKKERKNSLFQMMENDLQRIAMNDFILWPLDGNYIF
jgi:methylaspartate mutase epsilon subunit